MRRILALLLSLVMLLTMAATGSAASDIRVLFDEQEIQFDASPFVENDRTLVPVRALAERLGFTVGWDENEQKITLTKGDNTILLWIGSNKVVVNGKEGTIDVPAKKVNDRTFVPVRFIAERLGAHVAWDDQQNAAVVTSGNAFLLKLNKQQQKLVDQKMTADFQINVEMSNPDQANGGSISLKMPMHMDIHVYHNDMLMTMTMQLPAMGQGTSGPLTVQMAIKDGKIYTQNALTQQWQQTGTIDMSKGAADMSALLGKTGFGDLMKLQAEMLKDAVVSVAGQEEVDGVKAIRVDVDLSKVKFGALIDKVLATLPLPAGEKPDFQLTVDRYAAHFWINPETQFVYKTVLEMVMGMTVTDAGKTMTIKAEMKGELRARPVSEPIKFPDFGASSVTAEQKQAAQAYWDGLEKNVPMDACLAVAKEADAHWKDKTYTAGHDAAVKAAACFTKSGQGLATLTPPTDFAEGHKTLSLSLETLAKAYIAFGEAFDLAAKGDMTASDAKKAEAAKLGASGQQALMQAVTQIMQAAAKYDLQ